MEGECTLQFVNRAAFLTYIVSSLFGCVSTIKNGGEAKDFVMVEEICVSLKFFNDRKSTNRLDYTKSRFYSNDENYYKQSLKRWNINSDCVNPKKEFDIVYRYIDNPTSGRIWSQFASVITAHLIPYSTDYSVEIQLIDPTSLKKVGQEKVDIDTQYSALQLFTSISQMNELREKTGMANANDAFLVERTAILIVRYGNSPIK